MKILIIIISLSLLSACSIFKSSEQEETTDKNKPDEVYVFDEVSDTSNNSAEIDDLKKEVDKSMQKEKIQQDQQTQQQNENQEVSQNEETVFDAPTAQKNSFYLQLGAFSTLNRAEQFIKDNESKVPFKMSIVFNNQKGLYTVRSSAYKTKPEAEMIRDGFWRQNMFKDAFIVTE